MKWFFKYIWCPVFGHGAKTIRMPFFEAWYEHQVRHSFGSIHCARCGAMVGEYGGKK